MEDSQILMPALSPTMEEGGIAKWFIKPGDKVKAGDIIAEIETDKAIMELESALDCKIKSILVAEGTTQVKVNTPIAELDLEPTSSNISDTSADFDKETSQSTYRSSFESPAIATAQMPVQKENQLTVRETIRDAIAEEMRRDETVFLMGE